METKPKTSKHGKSAFNVGIEIGGMGYIVPGSKVVIMRDETAEQTSDGGIILREESQMRPLKGTIIALGQGIVKHPEEYDMDGVKVGMRATFSKYEGHHELISLMDGDSVEVEFMTAADLFLLWEEK